MCLKSTLLISSQVVKKTVESYKKQPSSVFRSSTERLVAPLLAKVRLWSSWSSKVRWDCGILGVSDQVEGLVLSPESFMFHRCDGQKWAMVRVGSALPSRWPCLWAAVNFLFLLFYFLLFPLPRNAHSLNNKKKRSIWILATESVVLDFSLLSSCNCLRFVRHRLMKINI